MTEQKIIDPRKLQEFEDDDLVINIITGRIGSISVNHTQTPNTVYFDGINYMIDGKKNSTDIHPTLVLYYANYDYINIDFRNLPQRQKSKLWRGEHSEVYYYVDVTFNVTNTIDIRKSMDNQLYSIGNYFQTREDAQRIANRLLQVFKQDNHDRTRNN